MVNMFLAFVAIILMLVCIYAYITEVRHKEELKKEFLLKSIISEVILLFCALIA